MANPQPATLPGYQLCFTKPASANGGTVGLANLEKAPGGNGCVEGVLYQLPREVITFLDGQEEGYHCMTVAVQQGNTVIPSEVYVADSPRTGLRPTQEYLDLLLAGAAEHGLSQQYINALQQIAVLPPLSPAA